MRSIPTITKNLLIVNFLAFVAMKVLSSSSLIGGAPVDLNDILGLHFFLADNFHIYQLFTYMFMHASFMHIFFNMFALWMFGRIVETVWGPKKFLFYYFVCGVGAGLFQEVAQFVELYFISVNTIPDFEFSQILQVAQANAGAINMWTTVGASGAIYGILLAFGMIFPEERIFIFPLPIPIKAKWFVIFYALLEVYLAISTSGNVAHLAHLGGMAFGFFLIRYWKKHPGSDNLNYDPTQLFGNMRDKWTNKKENNNANANRFTTSSRKNVDSDWNYNEKKKANQDEMDKILDKIRKSGYDSLSKEEKQKLFDMSNEK